jgi:hypothetical protein
MAATAFSPHLVFKKFDLLPAFRALDLKDIPGSPKSQILSWAPHGPSSFVNDFFVGSIIDCHFRHIFALTYVNFADSRAFPEIHAVLLDNPF